jgi:hypothetical protein
MLNVYFAVAANRVLVDSVSNQVSIIDLYEQLRAPSFPVLVPKLTFLFYVSREKIDPSTHEVRLVCDIGDKTIVEAAVQLDFKSEDTTRIVIGLDNCTLPQAGVLKAKLMDKAVELGSLELTVEQVLGEALNADQAVRH